MLKRRNLIGMLLIMAAFGMLLGACKSTPAMTSRDNPSIVSNGTGFFVTSDGYVVTCAHVVEDAYTIGVWVDGNGYRADLVAIDHEIDIAILKINHKPPHYFGLANFNSAYIGDKVYAMGFPLTHILGSEIRLTDGIISAFTGYEGTQTDFQISAPIQPGNSGGPVFNEHFEILGIAASQLKPEVAQNANFAVKNTYIGPLMPRDVRLANGNVRSMRDAVGATVQISVDDIVDGEPIFIVNNTGYILRDIRISPSTDDNWGQNRLPQTLSNGDSISRDLTRPLRYGNRYDFRATDSNGNIYEQRTVTVARDARIVFSASNITQTAQTLTGTYTYGSSYSIEFSGSNFTARAVGNTYTGAYTISGNTFTLTGHGNTANWISGTWTIVDSATLRDPDEDLWHRGSVTSGVSPTGTFTYGSNASIEFNGNRYTLRVDDASVSGTFTLSGSTFTLTGHNSQTDWIREPWTIVDANTLRDTTGDVWRKQTGAQTATSFSGTITGTYYYDSATYLTFNPSANNFTITDETGQSAPGPYRIAGNTVILVDSVTLTIVDSNTLRDPDGDLWRKQGSGIREISLSEWITSTIQDGEVQQFRVYVGTDIYYSIQWDDNDRTYSGNLSNPADVRVGIKKEGSSSYLVPTSDIGNYTGTYSSYSNEHRIHRTNAPRYDADSWYIIEVEAAYGGGTFRLRVY